MRQVRGGSEGKQGHDHRRRVSLRVDLLHLLRGIHRGQPRQLGEVIPRSVVVGGLSRVAAAGREEAEGRGVTSWDLARSERRGGCRDARPGAEAPRGTRAAPRGDPAGERGGPVVAPVKFARHLDEDGPGADVRGHRDSLSRFQLPNGLDEYAR